MLAVIRDGNIKVEKPQKNMAIIQDGRVFVIDERWITINADEEEGRKGQHVLIKENGNIVFGLGGKFKNLRDLSKKPQKPQSWQRDYGCDLSKKLGKEHYDNIRDKIENCDDENLKKVWQKMESKVLVADTHYNGVSYTSLRSIFINIEKDSKGTWAKTPYNTTVHECAHAIDFALGTPIAGKGRVEYCILYKNGLFGRTISEEINGRIEQLHSEMKVAFKLHGDDVKWLNDHGYLTWTESKWYYVDDIKSGKKLEEPIKYSKKRAYEIFEHEVNQAGDGLEKSTLDIGDMTEGATKGKAGSGHGRDYWKRPYFVRKGENAALAIEAFAEMTSATATNTNSLTVIKKILPKSYKVYQEMMEEAVKEIQKREGKK